MKTSVLEDSSNNVQEMVASGSPNWWHINNMRPSSHLALTSSWNDNQEFLDDSWSQKMMSEFFEGDKSSLINNMQDAKKLESFEEQYSSTNCFNNNKNDVEFQDMAIKKPSIWSQQIMPAFSPRSSCATSPSSNLFYSSTKSDTIHPPPKHSSKCNSSAKKARVQPSSSTFKVRKEKLGDRITALHQIVCPFGKTDTASVLLEAIGYIRFLQNQIEALSSPYLVIESGNMKQNHQRNTIDSDEEGKKDLSSRGLCLVPISCTLQVETDNGADYWAPAIGGTFKY